MSYFKSIIMIIIIIISSLNKNICLYKIYKSNYINSSNINN